MQILAFAARRLGSDGYDKIISVFAAKDMVLTVNGTAMAIKENDRIELFNGAQPPRQKVIRTTTFVRNLERLAGTLGQNR